MNAILLKKTLRDMGKSRGQSIALVIIVAIGVASFVGMIDGYRDLGSSYESTYERLSLADVTYQLQSAPESAVEGVSSIDGVRAVTGRLIYDTGLAVQSASAEKTQVRARLIGIPAGDHPEVDDVLVTEGDYLPAGNASSALVESHFAKAWGLRPGDTIHPLVNGRQTDLRIAGIAASPEYLIVSASRQDILPNPRAFAVLFVPRDALQKEFEAEDTVNNIAVLLEPGADKAVVSARIRSALEPYGIAETTLQKDQPSVAALRLDLEGYRQIGFLMPTLILLAAAASLFVMLGRQVRAQRVQIGLMKAVGTARASIALHYLGLSFLIAAIGAIAGVAAGYPLGVLITTEYAAELGIPLVRTHLYPDVVAGGFAVSLLAAVIAGIFPARRAARLAPAAAMRPDPAQALTGGGRSLFDRLIPLPLWARLSARNVFRVPSRSVSTLVGVIFAFILVISSWAMIDSMQKIIADNFINVERWDVQATFQFPRSMDSLSDITSRPGVLRRFTERRAPPRKRRTCCSRPCRRTRTSTPFIQIQARPSRTCCDPAISS
jgi:putative ABC transport system permease protein